MDMGVQYQKHHSLRLLLESVHPSINLEKNVELVTRF